MNTGTLLLRAEHTTILGGNVSLSCRGDTRAIHYNTGILIRDLSYEIQFTGFDYTEKLQEIKSSQHEYSGSSATPIFTPSPSSQHRVEYGDYFVYPAQRHGISSVVSYGSHIMTGDGVAVKRIRTYRRNEEVAEAQILAELKHPNICVLESTLHLEEEIARGDTTVHEHILFISPWVTYTLADPIRGRVPLSDEHACSFLQQCISALAYCHERSIMHRDVKPGNIGFIPSKPPHAVLLDFGAAICAVTSLDHMRGTIRYLAPEVMALKNGS
ncbi:hypothetical protein H2201_009068, partial [Coniosporium apollinis]